MVMTNPYCSLAELKAAITKVSGDADSTIEIVIEAASRAIDRFCNRPDGFLAVATATARIYTGSGRGSQRIDECTSITLVEVKASVTDSTYTAWAVSDWYAGTGDPLRPNFNKVPYTLLIVNPTGSYSYFVGGHYGGLRGFRTESDSEALRGTPTVRVTAKWGYATILPIQIKMACIAQSGRWYKRLGSSFADAVGSADMGQMFYKSLDADLAFILKTGRFVRPAIG